MHARTYLLAAGGFAVGTSAYVVSGLLPAVGAELGVSVTAAGQLTTAFALSYALGAPLLAVATGRWERRTLLVVALLVAAAGNGLAALAPTYPLLVVARIVTALGAAAYTPGATVVATELNPPELRGRAVAAVFGGITLALVAGVPAGSLLGGPLGYRGVFALVAGLCLLGALGVRLLLPRVEAPPAVGLRARLAVAADVRVLGVLAITVLCLLAGLSAYTYVAPLLVATAGIAGPLLGLLLLAYGAGAVVGNALGGRLVDRFGSRRPMIVVVPLSFARAGGVSADRDHGARCGRRPVRPRRVGLGVQLPDPEPAHRALAVGQRPAAVAQRLGDLPRRRTVRCGRGPADRLGRDDGDAAGGCGAGPAGGRAAAGGAAVPETDRRRGLR